MHNEHLHVCLGVCGVSVDKHAVESWLCDLCDNEKTQEVSLVNRFFLVYFFPYFNSGVQNTDCVLCPRKRSKTPTKDSESFLRAVKPTEGQGWVHVLCAIFSPEVTFSDVAHLRLAEGISTIPRYRWSAVRTFLWKPASHSHRPQRCTLCGETGGAVIRCSDCIREYHISCAWRNGHRFGFEIQAVGVGPSFFITAKFILYPGTESSP